MEENKQFDFNLEFDQDQLLSIDSEDNGKESFIDNKPRDLEKEEKKVKDIEKRKKQKEEDEKDMLNIDNEDLGEEGKEEIKEVKTKEEKKQQGRPKKEEVPEFDYKTMYELAKKKGTWTTELPDEFDGSEEAFSHLLDEEVRVNVDSALLEIDNKYEGLLTYLENGGDYKKWQKTHEESNYDKMSLDEVMKNDKIKEQLYRDYYTQKGVKDKLIEKNLKSAKDLESLDEEIADIHEEMSSMSKYKKEQIKSQQAKQKEQIDLNQRKQYNDLNKYINELEEAIPTNKLKKQDKDNITKLAVDTTWLNEKFNQDPIKMRTQLAILQYYGILDGKWDKVLKDLETKATKDTKMQFVRGSVNKGSESNNFNTDNDITSNIMDSFGKTFGKKR